MPAGGQVWQDSQVSEAQFRALANSIPNMAWMADPDGWVFWYNDRWYEYTGTTPEEMLGWGWQAVHHPDVLPEMLQRWTQALKTGEPFEMTFPFRRGSDGSFRIFMTRAEPLREDGRIVGWFGTNTDITEQERTRERLQLVINELNHRVKNMLATVQAIAYSSFSTSDSAAYQKFEQRLTSLARVHDLLTREQWARAELKDIVSDSIVSFGEERFLLSGDAVQVEPAVASALAMTLHELGTNAVKYGALSNDTGHVEIEWHTQQIGRSTWLSIAWREKNGPPVEQPSREGFGLKLIKRALAAERDSRVEHCFGPDGVTCTAFLPIGEASPR